MVPLQGIHLPKEAKEGQGLPGDDLQPEPRRPDPNPHGVPPRGQRLLGPIVRLHFREGACRDQVLLVGAEGDEEGVAPLGVQEVQGVALLVRERRSGVPLAPSGNDEVALRSEHPDHLLDVLLLVWHVLTRLATPDQVERVVGEGHVQCVHHLELHVVEAGLLGQLAGPGGLLRRERDACDLRIGEALGEDPGGAADAAPHVQDLLGGLGAAVLDHLVGEVDLGLLEVLHREERRPQEPHKEGVLLSVAALLRHRGVGAHVDVLAPVVLQDAVARPVVVGVAHAAIAVRPLRRVEPLLDAHEQGAQHQQASNTQTHWLGEDAGAGREARSLPVRGAALYAQLLQPSIRQT
mmetsp:Transcript_4157/g.8412  ORF Transcript_4157/g.8412 Transcript_4157/m.8412 type:complete len:350 (+) Transcript_4157:132-1181(+)